MTRKFWHHDNGNGTECWGEYNEEDDMDLDARSPNHPDNDDPSSRLTGAFVAIANLSVAATVIALFAGVR